MPLGGGAKMADFFVRHGQIWHVIWSVSINGCWLDSCQKGMTNVSHVDRDLWIGCREGGLNLTWLLWRGIYVGEDGQGDVSVNGQGRESAGVNRW